MPAARVTYNLTNDRVFIWPSERLSDEDYKRVKDAGFAWWPRGCFTATWTPGRLNLAASFGEVEEDDAPDDPEERATRYSEHAENAQARSDAAHERVEIIRDCIPFGQPILVGHHSEARARADQKRIERGMDTSIAEGEKAAYWRERAERAIAHAAYRMQPGPVARRIKELEADLRRWQRYADDERARERIGWHLADWRRLRQDAYSFGHHIMIADLTGEQAQDYQSYSDNLVADAKREADRWIAHIEAMLVYERGLLEKAGGLPADSLPLEVGGAILVYGHWRQIVRVNRATVTVTTSYSWNDKLDKTKIRPGMVKTCAEWQAMKKENGTGIENNDGA